MKSLAYRRHSAACQPLPGPCLSRMPMSPLPPSHRLYGENAVDSGQHKSGVVDRDEVVMTAR